MHFTGLGICREKARQINPLLLSKIKINQKLTENLYAVNKCMRKEEVKGMRKILIFPVVSG